jgi:predicted aspartyl protease
MRGRFDDSTILIPIEVYGVSEETKKTFMGIVDTGFGGYLTLPLSEAFPLGLVLKVSNLMH